MKQAVIRRILKKAQQKPDYRHIPFERWVDLESDSLLGELAREQQQFEGRVPLDWIRGVCQNMLTDEELLDTLEAFTAYAVY